MEGKPAEIGARRSRIGIGAYRAAPAGGPQGDRYDDATKANGFVLWRPSALVRIDLLRGDRALARHRIRSRNERYTESGLERELSRIRSELRDDVQAVIREVRATL